MTKPKVFKCREKAEDCEKEYKYQPDNIQWRGCCKSPFCILSRTTKIREKKEAKEAKKQRAMTRQKKQDAKTIKELLNEAQVFVNRYYLLRDKDDFCISCDTTSQFINFDSGHYIARGSGAHSEIRFHPFNINKQCSMNCNKSKSGNAIEYRKGLIKKIGVDNVEWLEGYHEHYIYTKQDALDIKEHFKELIKNLRRELE